MVHRPSKMMKHDIEEMHFNITPMMNLMVVLIPLLLSSAEFVRLGIIELNLPPAASEQRMEMEKEIPEEHQKELDLTVTVTDQGFFISSSLAVLSGAETNKPSLPLVDGQHDFDMLTNKLYEIKQKAGTRFGDTNEIIIMAESDITYQTIVKTMDASRQVEVEGKTIILFPNVSFSARIY
ncbi:MAG: biopolymer transporter ExbD [bacterium]